MCAVTWYVAIQSAVIVFMAVMLLVTVTRLRRIVDDLAAHRRQGAPQPDAVQASCWDTTKAEIDATTDALGRAIAKRVSRPRDR